MTNKPRYVIDTSTLVSALLFKNSIPRQAFDLAMQKGIILSSQATIDELVNVLGRAKFDKYLTNAERVLFLAEFVKNTRFIEVSIEISDCRDPKDNKFLELAVDGQATYIISSDDDLLALNPYRTTIFIVLPKTFIEANGE